MLRRNRSSVEWVPHDVVELILERVPVKSLVRFKCVSKRWKATIESPSFQQGQLIRRRVSRGPDVIFVPLNIYNDPVEYGIAQRFVFGSSIAYTVKLPSSTSRANAICRGSCDGLVCLYNIFGNNPNVLLNPATGWHRNFPISPIQQLIADMAAKRTLCYHLRLLPYLGFGKDNVSGTYKTVWLYNSSEFGFDNVTTCEVFDFRTNTWRYLLPASPYRILKFQEALHFDGSFYWLTEGRETKVLSLDLHTETFQVISKAPFSHAPDPHDVNMSILDNRLCVSHKNWPTQVIWSLDPSSGTWTKLCCIDLTNTVEWFEGRPNYALFPIAILEKNKLLLKGRDYSEPVLIHDLDTESCDLLFKPIDSAHAVCYFDSFLSVL